MSPLEGSSSGTGVLDDVEAAELVLWLVQSHDRNKCEELFERFQSDMKHKDLQISGLMEEYPRIKGEVGALKSGISILRNGNEVLKSSNEVLRIQTKDQEIRELHNITEDSDALHPERCPYPFSGGCWAGGHCSGYIGRYQLVIWPCWCWDNKDSNDI
jgi:hypothetical protein